MPPTHMSDVYKQLRKWFLSTGDASSLLGLTKIIQENVNSFTPAWHPLGFIHTKLAQGSTGDTFRLHIWSSDHHDDQEQQDKIHDHRFHISSRVVFGSVGNTLYSFESDVKGSHRELRVDYQPRGSILRETGNFGSLTQVGTKVHVAPTKYNIAAFDLHETTPPLSGLSLTVVHTTEPINEYEPRAIFRRDTALPPYRPPVLCDRDLWRALLERMLPI